VSVTGGTSAGAELFGRLFDPVHRQDPYPVYAEIRRRGPMLVDDHTPAVVVAGYPDCEALLRDPRLSAERWRHASSTMDDEDIPWDAPSSLWQPSFLSLDPPDHSRMRRLVARAFSPRTVARLQSDITRLVDDLLDRAARGEPFDVVESLAYPLPVAVICQLLGVPVADEHLFHRWSSQLARFVDGLALAATGSDAKVGWLPGMIEMLRYTEDLVAARRRQPQDDLISALLAIEEDGDKLTRDELVSTIVLLLVTGHETVVNLIGNSVLALLRHPEHLDRVRADPATVPAVLEETMRYDAPVQLTARVLREPARIGAHQLGTGDLVFLLIAAANRDPAANPEPDRFDPRRAEIRHLAFGLGPHYCLGAPLAKLQGGIAVTRFVQRLTGPELVLDPPPYRESVNLHGPSTLPVVASGVSR
jgi:cytochrome P450